MRARARLGAFLVKAASAVACALIDLGVLVAPNLRTQIYDERMQPKAGPGLLIILVVILALVSAGQAVTWAVHEALPRREIQP